MNITSKLNHVSVIIDNCIDEPLCLIEETDWETVQKARNVLVNFFGGEGVKVDIREVYAIQEIITL